MPLDKAYYFPESYNHLRAELADHWPEYWKKVQWFMAFDQLLFVEKMNELLDLKVYFETDLDGVCNIYLKELRKKRGVH